LRSALSMPLPHSQYAQSQWLEVLFRLRSSKGEEVQKTIDAVQKGCYEKFKRAVGVYQPSAEVAGRVAVFYPTELEKSFDLLWPGFKAKGEAGILTLTKDQYALCKPQQRSLQYDFSLDFLKQLAKLAESKELPDGYMPLAKQIVEAYTNDKNVK